jgi:hypothetical protein
MNTSRIAVLIFTTMVAGALSAATDTSPKTGQVSPDRVTWLTDIQKAQARVFQETGYAGGEVGQRLVQPQQKRGRHGTTQAQGGIGRSVICF